MFTNISEERTASIVRVEEYAKQEASAIFRSNTSYPSSCSYWFSLRTFAGLYLIQAHLSGSLCHYLFLESPTVNSGVARSSETSLNFRQTTNCHISKNSIVTRRGDL
jgi:hypothetical protein